MPRRFPLLLLAALLCACCAGAQEHMRLAGYLQMPGKPLMSYYVEVNIAGTVVKGYSITDWTGGSRVKAGLTGTRDPLSEMYIQENTMYDEGHSPFTVYCYFTAHLKLTIIKGRQRWSGPFESRQADGSLCDRGVMTLLDDAPDLNAPKPAPKPAPPPVPIPKPPAPKPVTPLSKPKPTPAPIPVPPPKPVPVVVKADTPRPRPVIVIPPKRDTVRPRPVVIKAPAPAPRDVPDSCLRRYDWATTTLELDVFDGWSIDGDVVSVYIGGQTLMNRATLTREKRHFSVPLSKGWNTLNIALIADGNDPPVTPNLILADGSKKYELEVSGDAGQTATICIFRK